MQYTYYVGEGREAQAVIKAANEKIAAYRAAVRAELENYPDGTEALSKGVGITGFLRKTDSLLSDEQCKDLSLRPSDRFSIEGVRYQSYVPRLQTAKGKELARRLVKISGLRATFSDATVTLLGVGRSILGRHPSGTALYHSGVGCKDGKLFVKIPGSPDDQSEHGDGFPSVPAWLRAPQGDEAMFFLNGK